MGNLIRCKCSLCGKVLLLDEALSEKEQTCPECGKESVVLQADGPPAPAPAPNLAGKKILLVDDDREFLNLMRVRLRPTGCAMITAMDGMTATAMLRKEQPDLVLLDLGLPGGDGFILLERWAHRSVVTPIIVISAQDPAAVKEKVVQAGARAFLSKNAPVSELFAAIEEAMK